MTSNCNGQRTVRVDSTAAEASWQDESDGPPDSTACNMGQARDVCSAWHRDSKEGSRRVTTAVTRC